VAKRAPHASHSAEQYARAIVLSAVAVATLVPLFVWGPRTDVLSYLSQVVALLVLAVVALWPRS